MDDIRTQNPSISDKKLIEKGDFERRKQYQKRVL